MQESNENNFVELLEIKKKCNSDVTSSAIGNVIYQIFKNVKIKSGRSKENWCKSTQRYYGLSWKIEENLTQIVEFTNIPNFLPPDYFVTSKSLTQVQIGHFTGEIVNGNKLMLEINLQADGYFSLFFYGQKTMFT